MASFVAVTTADCNKGVDISYSTAPRILRNNAMRHLVIVRSWMTRNGESEDDMVERRQKSGARR